MTCPHYDGGSQWTGRSTFGMIAFMAAVAAVVINCDGWQQSNAASIAAARAEERGSAALRGRLDGITRVFSHRINAYSVWAPVPGGGQKPQWLECHAFYRECITEYSDVPQDQPMWVEYEFAPGYDGNFSMLNRLTLHLHSIKDINAAGWQLARDGRTVEGMSVVIE